MLADIARRDVIFDISCHSRPGVVAAYQFEGFLYAVVTGRALVVRLVEKGCSEFVVVGDVYEVVVLDEVVFEGKVLYLALLF